MPRSHGVRAFTCAVVSALLVVSQITSAVAAPAASPDSDHIRAAIAGARARQPDARPTSESAPAIRAATGTPTSRPSTAATATVRTYAAEPALRDTQLATVPTGTSIPMAPLLTTVGTEYLVTTTADSNDGCDAECSLREAILAANANPGTDTIAFGLPAAPFKLTPAGLPTITSPVVIDGTTQPGFAGTPIVELSGELAGPGGVGLDISSGGSTVRGLVINRYGSHGIRMTGNAENVIVGNRIGTDVAGQVDLGSTSAAVFISGSPRNVVGGAAPGDGNLISGSGVGVRIEFSSGNQVLGNRIGTNAEGTSAIPNITGVAVFGANNEIGGPGAGQGNQISGNTQDAVLLFNNGTFLNLIRGNVIGLAADGLTPLRNGSGVFVLLGALNNTVGGTQFGEGNVISGNFSNGITFQNSGTTNNVAQGNLIGLDATGQTAVPNLFHGVHVNDSANGNTVGGSAAGAGNIIAGNNKVGVRVENATARILGNRMYANGELGIDVGLLGITSAPWAFPVLSSVLTNDGATAVAGTLNRNPATEYIVEFFQNSTCDPSGNGEGESFLGSTTVTTDGSGAASFSWPSPTEVPVGIAVAATATDSTTGETSEFSACTTAMAPPPFVVTTTDESDGGCDEDCSLREAMFAAEIRPGTDVIAFNIDGPGPHTLSPISPLPVLSDPVIIDGTTEPDFVSAPVIELSGLAVDGNFDGLRINGGNSTVRGLVLNGWGGAAIRLAINGNNIVRGNRIGTSVDGNTAVRHPDGSSMVGIAINSSGNTIGGTAAADGNLVSGNHNGIEISGGSATFNVVVGNRVGTNPAGTAAVANVSVGIRIVDASGNRIGGFGDQGNLISGNGYGIAIVSDGSHGGTQVLGNLIGTDVTGTLPLGNERGIEINKSYNTRIGTANLGEGNVIAGNDEIGLNVYMENDVVDNTSIQGNWIGTDRSGTLDLGNGSFGVLMTNARNVLVGGGGVNGVNVIAHNAFDGIAVIGPAASGNRIIRNVIHSNGGLGIDLNNDGPTLNDPGDGDTGPNARQNSPVLDPVAFDDNSITGQLDSVAGTYFVEVYRQATCDPSGFGEGEARIGSVTLAGPGTFEVQLDEPFFAGDALTATASSNEFGHTSEFSPCVIVSGSDTDVAISGAVTSGEAWVGRPVTVDVTVTNESSTDAFDVTAEAELPQALVFASASEGCAASGATVTCDIGSLPAGVSVTVTVTAAVITNGDSVIGLEAQASPDDSDPADNVASVAVSSLGPSCTIVGTGDDDLLTGTAGNDVVCGLGGNDTLDGFDGSDALLGGDGTDTLNGGDGSDDLYGQAGPDAISGGPGVDYAFFRGAPAGVFVDLISGATDGGDQDDEIASVENLVGSAFGDTLFGDGLPNALFGEGGGDTIDGRAGDDFAIGGDGHDTLHGGDDVDAILGGAGNDVLHGDAGFDFADYRLAPAPIEANMPAGLAAGEGSDVLLSLEAVLGTNFDDLLIGDDGGNVLDGGGGNDTIEGGLGADDLFGGDGDDGLDGGAGSDFIEGDNDSDTVTGGDGDDTIRGNAGNDNLSGGPGSDVADFRDAPVGVTVNLTTGSATGHGIDALATFEGIYGSSFDDTLTGDTGANFLFGLSGNDGLSGVAGNDLLGGQSGNDALTGGLGFDIGDYRDAPSAVSVNLTTGLATGGAGTDSLNGVEDVYGSAFNDTITGDAVGNFLFGFAGNDAISGAAGNDELYGGDGDDGLDGGPDQDLTIGENGDDTVAGGDGADNLIGGPGNDTLSGGTGLDAADYSPAPSAVTVNLATGTATGGAGTDGLSTIEYVYGSPFSDTLTGDALANFLYGFAGNDTIGGAAGNDELYGGDGDDGIDGGPDSDYVFGQNGADALNGDDGADGLIGGPGNDTMSGGLGLDAGDYSAAPAAVNVNLATGTATGGAGTDSLSTIEVVYGSPFNDTLTGDGLANYLFGFVGNDTIGGAAGDDELYGDEGDDGIDGGADQDFTVGGSGNDTVAGGDGGDVIHGGPGNDALSGGTGIDAADYRDAPAAVMANLTTGSVTGGAGIDSVGSVEDLYGSPFNDTLTGDAQNNFFFGFAGNDTMAGADGGDTLNGGLGSDALNGGPGIDEATYAQAPSAMTVNLATGSATGGDGTDTLTAIEDAFGSPFNDTLTGDGNTNRLTGHLGNDTLSGGAGNDYLEGRLGNDGLSGGTGTDMALYLGAAAGVAVNLTTGTATGGDGSDTLSTVEDVLGSSFNDTITGDGASNFLLGYLGNDTINGAAGNDGLEGGPGNDGLTGAAGTDFAYYWSAPAGVTVNLTGGTASGGEGSDTVATVESVIGSSFNDSLTGDGLVNYLDGGAGADALSGAAGNDTLEGHLGNDAINGGTGIDWVYYNDAAAGVTVNLSSGAASGAEGSDTLSNLENVVGSAFNDSITGTTGANQLEGGSGNDSLSGGNGDDFLFGQNGTDSLSGGGGNDYLDGGTGNDTLNGGTGTGDRCIQNGGSGTLTGCEATT